MKLFLLFLLVMARCESIHGQGANYFGDLIGNLGDMLSNSSVINIPGLDLDNILNTNILTSSSGNMLAEFLKFQNSANIGAKCLGHMQIFLEALQNREEWALRMIDAIGKPPSGLMNLKFTWPGEWKECIDISAIAYKNYTTKTGPSNAFKGQYCSVVYKLPTKTLVGQDAPLTIGMCFPNSCSGNDVESLMEFAVQLLPVNASSWPEPSVTCKASSYTLDGTAIAVICVCAVFAAVIALATIYDVIYINWIVKGKSTADKYKKENGHAQKTDSDPNISVIDVKSTDDLVKTTHSQSGDREPEPTPVQQIMEYKPDVLEKILLSFSVYTNGSKLLATSQPTGALRAVNGIRFLSMSWVIVGHSFGWYGTLLAMAENYFQFSADIMTRFEFQPIMNGTFSVDTFFVLSGLLVSYLSLREMKKRGGPLKFNWPMYYFHRFWRLTPPYMLLLMLNVALVPYFASGPFWNSALFTIDGCKTTWWKNILYINNFGDVSGSCMGWAWYLANDMQFYVISPLMLVPLFINPVLGGLSCLGFLLVSMVSSGLVSSQFDIPATMMGTDTGHYMKDYYIKPWCRIGPYALGFFTGYLLYRNKLKCELSRFVNAAGWLVATALGCLVVYGMFSETIPKPMSPEVGYLYNATSRNVWGACVCWVIFACCTGNGGPVNHILSWPGFVPLGRLTYCAYLVHPIIMTIYVASRFTTIYLYDLVAVYDCLGNLAMAYGAAFVISLAFEAPMMGLEKVLFRR